MPAAQKRPPFQQVTIEYHVQGDLDGTTLAPDVELDPTSEDYDIDDRGIHVVDVPGDLGLIDPDLFGPATQGDRCIPWVFIDSESAGVIGSAISVVDNTPNDEGVPVPSLQLVRFLTFGLPDFYTDRPTHIPQGSALSIAGYNQDGLKIVRLNIVAPHDPEEFAATLEACCCSSAACPTPPDPTLYNGADPYFTPGEEDYQIGGSDLSTGTRFYWVQVTNNNSDAGEGGVIPSTEVVDAGLGSVIATFDAPADTPPGQYELVAVDATDPSCNTLADVPRLTVWPTGCPVGDDPQPASPHTMALDGGPYVIGVTGNNFGGVAISDVKLIHHDTGQEMKTVSFAPVAATQINVTADPTTAAPADPTGLYDLQLIPTDTECPTQLILSVVEVT